MFGLIDCNSFYASCESVFNPALIGLPVIVLSNNDGCVIARSKAARALQIAMGAPFFKVKDLCQNKNVAVFSSNYELYGDMSARVMETLHNFGFDLEIYSVDECFLTFPDHLAIADIQAIAKEMKHKVQRWTGIPVSVGIGKTKTLAKVANEYAKTHEGVCVLHDADHVTALLRLTPVADVWGIGRRIGDRLRALGVNTAEQFRSLDNRQVRQQFSVTLQRTHYELHGLSCLPLEDIQPRKNICSSRAFSRPVTLMSELEEAVSFYTSRAAEKLRKQGSVAQAIAVFIHSNKFVKPQYYNEATVPLLQPTNDTIELVRVAKSVLRKIFCRGIKYQKAGILLLDLIPENLNRQPHLFVSDPSPKRRALMEAVDQLNSRFGRNTVTLASSGIERTWSTKANFRSGRSTTRWNEIIQCR